MLSPVDRFGTTTSAAAIDGLLQFRTGDEFGYLLGRNLQWCAGLGVAAGSRLARADRKGTEANQGDFASLLQRRHNSVERRVQGITRLDLGNLRVLRDLVD